MTPSTANPPKHHARKVSVWIPADREMMGTFREKYTVSRKLGAGGFGEVYIARRRVDKEVSLQHTFVQSIRS